MFSCFFSGRFILFSNYSELVISTFLLFFRSVPPLFIMATDSYKTIAPWLVMVCVFVATASSCTVLFAGPKATTDGSVFVGHSSDGDGETDPRFIRIPARDWEEGARRPIFASPGTILAELVLL